MIKLIFPWLIRAIPMGGYRTFIISILLVLVGIGMFAAALMGFLPSDIAAGIAATTILLGLQGFFGRAATAELENQLSLAIALIVDTRDKVTAPPKISLEDIREDEGDSTNRVRSVTMTTDSQATGQGWQ